MPTVDNSFVRRVIESDGNVPGYSKQYSAIYEYRMGDWKPKLFVTEGGEDEKAFNKSPYVKQSRLIWTKDQGLIENAL